MPNYCFLCAREILGSCLCLWLDHHGWETDANEFDPGDYLCPRCAGLSRSVLGHIPTTHEEIRALLVHAASFLVPERLHDVTAPISDDNRTYEYERSVFGTWVPQDGSVPENICNEKPCKKSKDHAPKKLLDPKKII